MFGVVYDGQWCDVSPDPDAIKIAEVMLAG
jgi:hypothetical protein